MTFVRTVLGDIEPARLGVTYAHEHLVIDGGTPVQLEPDFDLSDVDRMAQEVSAAMSFGLSAVVDAMPCDAGRNATKLAELSRRTGLHIVAPTGLHLDRFYGPTHWSHRLSVEDMADLFTLDVSAGIDSNDYSGPVVHRTAHRAGVIKVAGGKEGLSARDLRTFEAAAQTHARTGAPILTHCERGTGALQQVQALTDFGVMPGHVVLSHVDKVVDRAYHRELLGTGAFLEYDSSFRWGEGSNGTLTLIGWALEDGSAQGILLGMDAARQGYYHVYGGSPGLGWLLDGFSRAMDSRGIDASMRRRLFVENPARAFAFVNSHEVRAA